MYHPLKRKLWILVGVIVELLATSERTQVISSIESGIRSGDECAPVAHPHVSIPQQRPNIGCLKTKFIDKTKFTVKTKFTDIQ